MRGRSFPAHLLNGLDDALWMIGLDNVKLPGTGRASTGEKPVA